MAVTVGIREFKNHLSQYLRQVRAGVRLQITDRGQPIAEIAPPEPAWTDPNIPPGLLELARRGKIRLATKPYRPYHMPPGPPLLRSGTVQDLIDEDRGD